MATNQFPIPLFDPAFMQAFLDQMLRSNRWDPEVCRDWDNVQPKSNALLRMNRDVNKCKPAVPDGCYIETHEDDGIKDISKVHAIVLGPKDTPYEGGFFHFLIRFPPDYPSNPPRVKLMTTDSNTVRFNPNLYSQGVVCVSMLGTWGQSTWTPAQSLYTVLEAIQEIMNKSPYDNEPDLKRLGKKREVKDGYHEYIYHETLRVAVCGMIDRPNTNQPHRLPESLRNKIKELFLENYDFYLRRVNDKIQLKIDGKTMIIDTYGNKRGQFSYKDIKTRLETIHGQLTAQS